MTPEFEVAIIGTGFAGLGMAMRLKASGINSFVIFERSDDVSGVWKDNTYPGCACDVHSVLYSFSFRPGRSWTHMYAPASEITQYLRDCTEDFKLGPHIRFKTNVSEVSYDENGKFWTVLTSNGKVTARVLISAAGGLNNPALPVIDGQDKFQGKAFHTARWDNTFDFKNKNVAVIGTGASGIQVVPELAKIVKNLYLFQRTSPWVIAKVNDRPFNSFEKFLLQNVPLYHWFLRKWLFAKWESRAFGYDIRFNRFYGGNARRMLNVVKDPETRKKLTPDDLFGCKRTLQSNEYYPAINRPNVKVITNKIMRLEASSIVTDQHTIGELDAIVYATGFATMVREEAKTMQTNPRVVYKGKGGIDLAQTFMRDGPSAYFGTAVPGFPNLFFILGPNSGINHNSLTVQMEAQFHYIMSALNYMKKKSVASIEVKHERTREYNAFIQNKMKRTVYVSGCKSYFQTGNGMVFMLWPFTSLRFRLMTRKFDPENYELTKY